MVSRKRGMALFCFFPRVLACVAPPLAMVCFQTGFLDMNLCVDTEGHEGGRGYSSPPSSGGGGIDALRGGFRGEDAQHVFRYNKKPKNLVTSSYWSHGLLGPLPAAVHLITVNINNTWSWHFSDLMVWRSWRDNVRRFCPVVDSDRVTESQTNNERVISALTKVPESI